MRNYLLIVLVFCTCILARAQRNIDVLHYKYNVEVSYKDDTLFGAATIKFVVAENTQNITFDLFNLTKGKGMTVFKVLGHAHNMIAFGYTQDHDRLIISRTYNRGDTGDVMIFYKGIPDDGLIISKNKYGERTFFADNLPNRAQHWIPCADRADDQA